MPRVFKAKAAKDYPDHGIAKGDEYFYWSFFRGPKMMSKTMPKRSQTTGSAKLSNILAVEESLQAALSEATCPEDVIAALDAAISDGQSSIDEYDEAISNLEDGFPNGCPAKDETEEARDNIQSWLDELENAKSEVEHLNTSDYLDEEERMEEIKADLTEKLGREATPDEVSDVFGRETFEWDDLSGDEQEAMLSDAQDTVNSISLEL